MVQILFLFFVFFVLELNVLAMAIDYLFDLVIVEHADGVHVDPIGYVEESEEEGEEPAREAVDGHRSVARPLRRRRSGRPRGLTH